MDSHGAEMAGAAEEILRAGIYFKYRRKQEGGGRQEGTEERRLFFTRLRVGHKRLNNT